MIECENCGRSAVVRRTGRKRFCSRGCKDEARIARGDQWRAHKRWYLKSTYGITIEQYDEMCEVQDGRCAICGHDEPVGRVSQHGEGYWLHVDHDHDTGRIRGLLCSECNVGIGKFGDDPEALSRAAAYLVDFTP